MNILTDKLPETCDISGKIYQLNTDFRTCLRIIMAFEDESLTPQEKQMIMIGNLFPIAPDDPQAAMERAGWFLNAGKAADDTQGAGYRLYSFTKDADFIFSAFRQTHGIDLETAELHWWKFMALFMDLGSETTFCNLIGLRKRIKNGTATKEERQSAREMGDAFVIPEPDDRTLDEKIKEREFLEMIRG